MGMEMRLARAEEASIGMAFIEEGRKFQRLQGFVQWTEEYPDLATVIEDIRDEKGYLLTEGQVPVGYLCIDFAGEIAYRNIEGAWKSDQSYAVIHRMALGQVSRGKGASQAVFRLAKQLCLSKKVHSIRMDTDEHNQRMQHILNREGFQYCGIVQFQGSQKLAYQLDFSD